MLKLLVGLRALFASALANKTIQFRQAGQSTSDLACLVNYAAVVIAFETKLNTIFILLGVGAICPVPKQTMSIFRVDLVSSIPIDDVIVLVYVKDFIKLLQFVLCPDRSEITPRFALALLTGLEPVYTLLL